MTRTFETLQPDLATGRVFDGLQRMITTGDRREGTTAFNEKRRPQFTGRQEKIT
jgi:1,4-dihydroxy-2-naphthoyl-CoA synthase